MSYMKAKCCHSPATLISVGAVWQDWPPQLHLGGPCKAVKARLSTRNVITISHETEVEGER